VTAPTVHPQREVWLRGNVRPGAAVVLVTAVVGGGALAGAVAVGLSGWLLAGIATLVALVLINAVVAAWVVSQPRLARVGNAIEVRLAPGQVERVPLEIVECIFHGSDPVLRPRDSASNPRFRVGTVVVRLAERATQWRARPTFRQWGTWEDGHVVIDGRWCEPLTRETVQGVATRLLEAKREVAEGCTV
jgi:hypothetical protein